MEEITLTAQSSSLSSSVSQTLAPPSTLLVPSACGGFDHRDLDSAVVLSNSPASRAAAHENNETTRFL